jgi:hypothetical protein
LYDLLAPRVFPIDSHNLAVVVKHDAVTSVYFDTAAWKKPKNKIEPDSKSQKYLQLLNNLDSFAVNHPE